MSTPNEDLVVRLEQSAKEAENIIHCLTTESKQITLSRMLEELKAENESLKLEVSSLVSELDRLEKQNQFMEQEAPVSGRKHSNKENAKVVSSHTSITQNRQDPPSVAQEQKNKPEKTNVKKANDIHEKKDSAAKAKTQKAKKTDSAQEPPVDVGRLDFRIGRIINVKKHPDAESLYVEDIDIGEEKPRTIVSGLVKHVPLDEMQNRLVMVLCNLKPAKMRGVTSEGMVMCASSPNKVEILVPPQTCVPGDEVVVDGYPRNPDAVLNPKKKIFETVAVDLKTNSERVATYKGVPLRVQGKGDVTTASLTDVFIK